MGYVVVSAAAEAAYAAKRSVVHHMSAQNPRMAPFDALTDAEHRDVAAQVAAAICADRSFVARARWDDPDCVFWHVARIVARSMGHEVLDGDA